MIEHQLKQSINILEQLIETTLSDLSDIRAARHQPLLNRVKIKEDLVVAFETQKSIIDAALEKAAHDHPDKELRAILNDEDNSLLAVMTGALTRLHAENKRFATMVMTVGEFYTSLLDAILPSDSDGYTKKRANATPSFLEVRG